MNFEPFDTTLVASRIQAAAPLMQQVSGAADYAAVRELRGFRTPSAYVVLVEEEAGQQGPRSARAVPARTVFGVVLALRNYRTGLGDQMAPEARTLIGQVRNALVGWQPPVPGATAIQWTGGSVVDYDESVLLFADTFTLTHVLQR